MVADQRQTGRDFGSDESTGEILYGEYAGFATRAVAFVVDMLIISGILMSIGLGRSLIDTYFGTLEFGKRFLDIVFLVITVVIVAGYPIAFWMLIGQTPGKYLMGLRVIRTDGGRVTFTVSVRRLIGYYISAILLLGYFWVLIDDQRQAWHDIFAGTYVVYAWSKDPKIQREISVSLRNERQLRQERRQAARRRQPTS